MKNLILILSLSFVLFSCFEKEEEVAIIPTEGDIMQCEKAIKFIEEVNTYPAPREGRDRASIEKYSYNGKITYYINPTGNYWTDDAGAVIDGNCNSFCDNSQIQEENTCLDWWEKKVYIETVWKDNR